MKHSESWTRDCRDETTESHHFNGEVTNIGLTMMYEDNDQSKSKRICEWRGYLGVLVTKFLISDCKFSRFSH